MSDESDDSEYYSKEDRTKFEKLDRKLCDLQGTVCRNKKSDPIYFCDYTDEKHAEYICFMAHKSCFYADYKDGKIYIHDHSLFSLIDNLRLSFRYSVKKVFEDVFQPISYNDRLVYPFNEIMNDSSFINGHYGPCAFTCTHRIDLENEFDLNFYNKDPVIAGVIISMSKREAGLELIRKSQEKFDTEYFILVDLDQEKLTRTIFLFELGNEIYKDEQNLYAINEMENEKNKTLLTTLPFKKSVLLKRASSNFVNNYDSVEEIIEIPITILSHRLR